MIRFATITSLILFSAGMSGALASEAPRLSLPIDCRLGQDCWIFNYVDVDPGPGRSDFACGQVSYDGHKGTDFGLRDESRIADGVAVLAAAPGRVVGSRDGMADVNIRKTGKKSVKGRECGNGVRVDHGGGWVTQYCHMRKGSVVARRGQRVRRGERLGDVGISGLAEFPHVHITLTRDAKVVDPFRGLAGGPACGLGNAPLWNVASLPGLAYRTPKLFNAGFLDRVPSSDEINQGRAGAKTLARDATAMVFWAQVSGLKPGDRFELKLIGPDGTVIAKRSDTKKRHRIRAWLAVGRRARGEWAGGVYRGEAAVYRTVDAKVEATRLKVKIRME
ncbi:MAG: M23 family metallopeptidase [Rhodospirillaceae bacterium]|nr:M23 family metallopeptidase [Rhodospirillaceae bacterium]